MSDQQVDKGKRRFLAISTSVVGGVGGIAAAVPFISSMMPSESAKAAGAPVTVDLTKLQPGQKMDIAWRGKPVWVIRRTPEMLEQIRKADPLVADPNSDVASQQPAYAKNAFRSIEPELFVAVGVCTHLGCSPTYRPEVAPPDLGPQWPGGFFCPCHQSKFDLAGRVFKGVPAPINLLVPSYELLTGGSTVVVGEDSKGVAK
jgi:ubiquinol-cytochrome c reductase iron-sulfur subunit